MWYKLDKYNNPIPDETGGQWRFDSANLEQVQVGNTSFVEKFNEDCSVSTVFLGFDHNHSDVSFAPVLWETLVFGGPLDGEGQRYSSYDAAIEGHGYWVGRVELVLEEVMKKKQIKKEIDLDLD